MDLPIEIENQFYVKKVLCNNSLEDIENEQWEIIEGFENYNISNYGRLKSIRRISWTHNGGERILPEIIMKLIFIKQYNNYLKSDFYSIQCTLCYNGQKSRKSIARLVYYHFVEKFNMEDRSIIISFKDNDSLNLHVDNLEKISSSERRLKTFRMDNARNRKVDYQKPVSQYTVNGDLVANFDSIFDAEKAVGVGCESIQDVVTKVFLTAGGFRWFLQSNPPKKEDFIIAPKLESANGSFNISLWEKLGKPTIDINNLPPCLNLSLTNISGELWKPIPGFEDSHFVSNKGRIKRLSGWTAGKKKFFIQEKILPQILTKHKNITYCFCVKLTNNEKKVKVTTTQLIYYCFVKKFDIYSKSKVIVNQNESLLQMDISKLSILKKSKK
jgi:hypothetical protein